MSPLLILGYLGSSVAGIAALGWGLHRFGHRGGEMNEEDADALAAERGGRGAPLRTRRARLYETQGGALVVRTMGARLVASELPRDAVVRAETREGALRLRLARFEDPWVTIETDEPERVRDWLAERGVLPR